MKLGQAFDEIMELALDRLFVVFILPICILFFPLILVFAALGWAGNTLWEHFENEEV